MCSAVLSSHLSSLRSGEVVWDFPQVFLGRPAMSEMPLPEIAPRLLTPPIFFFFKPQLRCWIDARWRRRCGISTRRWMLRRSIRHQSDIYIRKNGCCRAREGRKGRRERSGNTAVITTSSLMLPDSHFAPLPPPPPPPAVALRWYMEIFSLHHLQFQPAKETW